MVTRDTSVVVVKVLAALATFALTTIVAFWLWERVFNATLAGYFGLAMGLLATAAVVMTFDRIRSAGGSRRRRR